VADFLEKGLLGNLVSLFTADPSLYPLLRELLGDEKIGVRLGTSALVESLAEEGAPHDARAAKALLPLLESSRPVLRGDAAYLLGVIGRTEALPGLRPLLDDDNEDVREAAAEAVERIEGGPAGGS
jgi:HEAT repeat protein